jgi:hypothetical protein
LITNINEYADNPALQEVLVLFKRKIFTAGKLLENINFPQNYY